ncbi:MAG: hypothetical protein M3Y13_01265 [Armatimonadota bacterium]|nr:hypothetical protein [Armatimonadota bacterium]
MHSTTTSFSSSVSSASAADLPTQAVDRLYRVADLLARDWQNAGLSDVFGSSMIAAVVRFLEKTGTRNEDGTSRSAREQADFAEALLRRFWAMNARRDAERNTQAHASGRRPEVLALDFVSEGAAATGLYDTFSDDLLAGETGRAVARFLETLGWPRERAWAFVWRESGREWDDVAFLLAERFEADATPGSLRKWGERYFEPVLPRVRAFLQDAQDVPCESAAVSRASRSRTITGVTATEKGNPVKEVRLMDH